MPRKEVLLDEEAQKLFEQLGGIDTRERGGESTQGSDALAAALMEEEGRMDDWRILMVEFIYLLTGYLINVRLSGLRRRHEEDIESLVAMLAKLSQMPHKDQELLIRYRGGAFSMSQKRSEKLDYVITFGDLLVDIPVIKAMVNRKGITLSHLPGRLSRAFESLASMEINTIHLDVGTRSPEDGRLMKHSLQILARYFMARAKGGPPSFQGGSGHDVPPIVFNENGQPDPNLTLLAGLNRLKRKTIQELVQKVHEMMNQPGLEQCTDVYGAIFQFKKLREQLVKPPLEINNVRWLIVEKNKDVVSQEKAHLVRTIAKRFGHLPETTAQLIQGIYGKDFSDIEVEALESRLGRVGDFIDEMEKTGEFQSLHDEVLKNVEKRLDRVPDEVIDNLYGEGAPIEARPEPDKTVKSKLNEKIMEIVSFFKRRSDTKKKIREMVHHAIDFDDQDYETIAKDFEITVEDSKTLLELLKGCFDQDGHFLRGAFEKNIPQFAKHEKKVFDFLWYYLKEIKSRADRVAFLNSLQSLIDHMEHRENALRVLLNDFIRSPHTVTFSDRNTMMLANVFIQKKMRERQHDIEITPEEVLQFGEEIDRELAHKISGFIDGEQERFFQKIRTIHNQLKEALEPKETDAEPMPCRFLFTLEREVYIFLSLVGGPTGHKIIQSAVKEYGDPHSEIYRLKKSTNHMKELLMLLQVAIRGLGRFGQRSDLSLLDEVMKQEKAFADVTRKSQNNGLIRRVMGWVDMAQKNISPSPLS